MREEILKLCEEILPQIDFRGSKALVDDGLLDSISIMSLVSELSLEYGVIFDMNDLEPKDLNSIEAIVETVQGLISRK